MERDPRTREEFRRNFIHAVSQLEIMRQAIVDNQSRPVAIFTNRNGEREYLLLDHSFLNAMSGGVNKLYQQRCKAGDKDFADHVVATVIKDE